MGREGVFVEGYKDGVGEHLERGVLEKGCRGRGAGEEGRGEWLKMKYSDFTIKLGRPDAIL